MENQKVAKNITLIQLQVLLSQLRTSTMATFVTLTEPSMNKGGNPYYGRLKKKTTQNVTINFNYGNAVNNQLAREGKEKEFVPHARKWGERIDGTPLIQHKGECYVEAKMNGKPQSVVYFCDGSEIAKEEIALYLKSSNSNAEHQGVEKEIIIRDTKLSNVQEVKMGGEHYIVK
jgi:hypothetical protein